MGVSELAFLKFFVHMLAVEDLRQVCGEDFQVVLSEVLAEADTHSTTERSKTRRVALFAFRSKTHITFWVETLRDELVWTLPLGLVHVKSVEMIRDNVALLEFVVAELAVLGESDWRLDRRRRVEA